MPYKDPEKRRLRRLEYYKTAQCGEKKAAWRARNPYRRHAQKLGVLESEVAAVDQGACRICGKEAWLNTGRRGGHLDHCHKTLKMRGVLCAKCNQGLGFIERDGFLDSALAYLSATTHG